MNDGCRVVAATVAAWVFAALGVCGDLPAPLGLPSGPGIWCLRTSPHALARDHEERLGMIEDHSGSELLHFAQLDAGTTLSDWLGPARPLLLWRVWLDFKDLSGFDASPAVRAAFDPGFAVLHELLHGLGFRDPEDGGQVGPLEEVLNRARAELGLPLRDRYAGETLPVAETLLSVRLRFRSAAAAAGRGKARFQYPTFLVDTRTASRTNEEDGLSAVCCPHARRWTPRN